MKILKKQAGLALLLILAAVAPAWADGFIVIPNPHHRRPHRPTNPFPLIVDYHHVTVTIEDQVATTAVDQVFSNPGNRRLEGYYLFPLPRHAVIKRFSMTVNGRELEAELLDAKRARRFYEDIVRRQMDPALLEYSETGLFKVRIFPIEPHAKKRVRISYREVLLKEGDTIEYLYPLNTEKFSAQPLKEVSITVNARNRGGIKHIFCPTHKTEVIRRGSRRATVSYEERDVRPDTDFKLFLNTQTARMGLSLLSYRKQGEDGFFYLSIQPDFISRADGFVEKDIVFVLDSSGSMAGKKLEQAKRALLFCVANLNKGDRFDIIRFSTEAEALFGRPAKMGPSHLAQAGDFIRGVRPIGGTNIEHALKQALTMITSDVRPSMIVFLTDGKPTIGETGEAALVDMVNRNNRARARVFTFGIGTDINTHLLDKITEATRAYRTYISPDEDIEVKVSRFYTKVQSPILTDLKLRFSRPVRVYQSHPANLPDLFKGTALTLFGRYRGSGPVAVTLEGRTGEKTETFRFPGVHFVSPSAVGQKHDFIPQIWAARRVGYLLDILRLQGESREVVEEVTLLARRFGIVTPYTSYLIVEDEEVRSRRGELDRNHQILAPRARVDSEFQARNRREMTAAKKKSGAGSVRASRESQRLQAADEFDQMVRTRSRIGFRDAKGRRQVLAEQMKTIQGRAVYHNGAAWIDSGIYSLTSQTAVRIRFASNEYFNLLKKYPDSGQFLALGQNVKFVLDGQIVEIHP